eukprot:m.264951 g.264951  ORF g.264951 m.264951 type:complete len:354 (-) comp58995_c0_seq1:230-1291(-)
MAIRIAMFAILFVLVVVSGFDSSPTPLSKRLPSAALSSNLVNISTLMAMRNEDGEPIYDCLEPHVIRVDAIWYAYGFTVRNQSEQFATTCYSSTDLKVWTKRAYFPTNSSVDGTNPQLAVALWYVVYNAKNKEFIGFGGEYGVSLQVYTSSSPVGPFLPRSAISPLFGGMGDLLVHVDSNGIGYLVYNSYPPKSANMERFTYIYQLDDDYYDVVPSTLCNTTAIMEGLWMVKQNGSYFLFGSPLVGYGVADNFYLSAPTPLGPWTNRGRFAPAGSDTFHTQTFQGLVVTGSKGSAHVFIGHRWGNSEGPPFPNATSVWLPLRFETSADGHNTVVTELKWYDEWILDLDGEFIL